MNEALVGTARAHRDKRWIGASLHAAAAAWRELDRRHWAIALAVGFVVGLAEALVELATLMGDEPALAPLAVLLVVTMKFVPIYLIAACLMVLGLAMLQRSDLGATPAFASHVALVVIVALAGGAIGHLVHRLSASTSAALGLPDPYQAAVFTWSQTALFSLGRSMTLMIVLSLATLVYLYLRNARRTAQRLAAAQLRRAEAERRVLAEELNGTQAMVEPALLFDTLRRTESLFERDAASAQRLLDALIAYLRAALPPMDAHGSTVGQQVELVRARLEIERIRLDGRLSFDVDVPPALAGRPLAPLLLAPLATNAIRHAIGVAGGGDVTVRARHIEDRLVIEITDSGPGRAAAIREGAGLAGVRERLERLYGAHARLVLTDRAPQGLCARVELDARSSA